MFIWTLRNMLVFDQFHVDIDFKTWLWGRVTVGDYRKNAEIQKTIRSKKKPYVRKHLAKASLYLQHELPNFPTHIQTSEIKKSCLGPCGSLKMPRVSSPRQSVVYKLETTLKPRN